MKEAEGPKKLVHVVLGTPDEENCPICRAHGVGPLGVAPHGVDQGDPAKIGAPEEGSLFVQELSLLDILRCPCPMCAEARKEALERS